MRPRHGCLGHACQTYSDRTCILALLQAEGMQAKAYLFSHSVYATVMPSAFWYCTSVWAMSCAAAASSADRSHQSMACAAAWPSRPQA